MCVANREIIEPPMHSRVATNREVGLIAVHVEGAAVDASDSYSSVTGFAGRKRHREVVLARLRSTGSRIEDCARRKFIEKLVIIDDVHPLRKLRSKRMTLRPHRLGGKRIVIARHQEDWRMSAALIAKRHGQPLPEILSWGRVVEQVAGAYQRVDRIAPSDVQDGRD